MLTLHYFASLRETLGVEQETLTLPTPGMSVAELIDHLVSLHGASREALLDTTRVLVAVDQTIVERDHALQGGEEVAFFPPMTGG
ncbi:MAG: molybdopterin converting factor subunit 1 [Pseudomonadales bacterium]|nr:molybdopterin converting factor subunit 1 [Pseudomonadales bacterium]MCP5357318.1 molybdopterin converting factor subunit 1 [Pseudomonadales bacterium]